MTDPYTNLLYGLAGVGIAGFVGWTVMTILSVKKDIRDLELLVHKEFVKQEKMEKVETKVDQALQILFEICGKLGVPIRRD